MSILRLLLWWLPADFRQEYGHEILETAEDQWRALERNSPLGMRWVFWIRQWTSVLRIGIDLRRERGLLGEADRLRHREEESRVLGLLTDVRHALRSLKARPGFTLVAALTLALGVGATTTMFGVVRSVLLNPLPYPEADDIVVLQQVDTRDGTLQVGVSAANLKDIQGAVRSLSAAAVADAHGLRWIEDGRGFSLRSWLVSEGFFEAMGIAPTLGRTFRTEEFTSGQEKVVLLSHDTWRRRFAASPEILGRELVLDGDVYTVIGVLPEGFSFPSASEIWAPRPRQPWDAQQRGRGNLQAVGRLAPGVDLAMAQAELDRLAAELATVHPQSNAHLGLRVLPLREVLLGHVDSPLKLLLGAVFMVLLIAIVNVAGLQLARGGSRSQEYALRGALGASSGRILRLVTVEGLLLALVGGFLGIAFAFLAVDLVQTLGSGLVPRIESLRLDGAVLAFALLTATGSSLAAALIPVLRGSSVDLQGALSQGFRGTTQDGNSQRVRHRLVVVEIALALVLTIGAGLLVRSFDRLLDRPLGFDPQGRLAVQVWAYDDQHRMQPEFFTRSLEEISSLPGVEAVGLTSNLPLADDRSILTRGRAVPFAIEGDDTAPPGPKPSVDVAAIDDTYPEAMGIAVEAGRSFSSRDHPRSSPVAMVNAAFVRRHFPNANPLGRRITLARGDDPAREIVGILADVRRQGFASEPLAEAYVPLSQTPSAGLTFVIKTHTDPATMVLPVQQALRRVDPRQAVWAARPLSDLLGEWHRQRQFITALLMAFALLALTLAAIGVYGLMAFSVEQQARELGIRRALGSTTRDILFGVLRRGLGLALTGVALGVLGSLALTQLLRGILFEVAPFDPWTFGVLSLGVLWIAMLAAWLPARRATRVDPLKVLRLE